MPCPLPSLWGGACGRSGWPRPPVWGSVFYRDMVWLLPLVSSNVIVTCSIQNMMLLLSPCKRCPCPCSDAVLRKKHWLGSFSSLWFAWVRSGCAGPLGAGRPGGRGPGEGGGYHRGGGGGWVPGTRQHKWYRPRLP